MGTYTFRLLIDNLCAFVPDEPFEEKTDPSHVHVLLPHSMSPRRIDEVQAYWLREAFRRHGELNPRAGYRGTAAADNLLDALPLSPRTKEAFLAELRCQDYRLPLRQEVTVPSHAPVLVYDPEDVVPPKSRGHGKWAGASIESHFRFRCPIPGDREKAVLSVFGQQMSLHGEWCWKKLRTNCEPPNYPGDPPKVMRDYSLLYLLPVNELFDIANNKALKIKKDYLKKPSLDLLEILSARLSIDHGYLYVSQLHRDRGKFIPWNWYEHSEGKATNGNGKTSAYMATEVALEIKDLAEPVELRLRYFGDKAGQFERLVFRPREGQHLVEVYLRHSELERIVGLPQPYPELADSKYLYDWDVRSLGLLVDTEEEAACKWRDIWTKITDLGGELGLCKGGRLNAG